MRKTATIHCAAGIAIVFLGGLVLFGWLTHVPMLVQMRPEFVGMTINSALSLVLLGTALILAGFNIPRTAAIQTTLGVAVAILGTLVLMENMIGIDLRIDLQAAQSWLRDGNPHPGRMAPNTAIGYILAGLVLVLSLRVQSKFIAVVVQIATFSVLVVGLTGLVGYTLKLDMLYSWFSAARMALHTSFGMILVGVALWSSWRDAPWYRSREYFDEDEKIAFVGAALLAVIALTAGVAGFASQQTNLEAALTDSLPSALKNQTTIFHSTVNQSVTGAKSIAGRPNLLRLTAALGNDPENQAQRSELGQIGRSILASGVVAVRIVDQSNRELLSLGKFADGAKIAIAVDAPSSSLLLWDDTLFLKSVLPLVDASGATIGSLQVEEPLPLITSQFSRGEGLGRTGEMGMCFADPDDTKNKMLCFPQFRTPKVYRANRLSANGKPTPMSYAMAGETGIFKGLDYRGNYVIAAYGPLTSTGLGIVIKKNTEELFEPIRRQLQWTIPLLLLLATMGAFLLRSQIRPLASRLLRSERDATEKELRIRTVVDNVGEGIITLNQEGMIETFNAAAMAIFGYAPDEVIGGNIRMLMPQEMRGPHDAGMHRYLNGGAPHVVGKGAIELPGLHKNGTVFSLELTVNAIRIGAMHQFVGIVRDITERKEAEQALFEEKERLHVTLSSIGDAVITTDVEGRVTYLNPVAETMTGWTLDEAIGRQLPEIFHIINELTDEIALNPVEIVLRDNRLAGLAENTALLQRDGGRLSIEDSAAPIRDKEGHVVGVVLVFHDVSEARQMAKTMTHQATHDALTGIINRREFEHRLELAIQSAKRESKEHTILYLDLDRFKIVNDTCGHGAGDELLRQLTSTMLAKLRQSDTLARLGGDEFGVLLDSCPAEPAMRIADLLRQAVSDFHFVWLDKVFPIGVSIGLMTFGSASGSVEDALRLADAACFIAKDKGRNRIHVHTQGDAEVAKRHGEMGWIARLQKALDENRFVLYTQKILPLGGHEVAGGHCEVLLRMKDEDGTLIPPMAFIPAAERYGLMPQIDRWVINAAFSRLAQAHSGDAGEGTCAINLSGTSICDDGFLAFVQERFDYYKTPPNQICFEITETAAITNLTQATALIRELKKMGCRFSLDDFGSGMSSFAYLKHLPVDYLKIDGGFVKDMMDDKIDCAMVEAINHIGHVMGIRTIAEFVENDEIVDKLRAIGVDFAQGYGIEKPKAVW